MSKRYSNVYTILEKIKKGDIEKKEDRYFGKMRYFRRSDLITPHLHYIDETRLENIIKSHIADHQANAEYYVKLMEEYKKKQAKVDNLEHKDFQSEMLKIYKDFPKHLIYDIFKMYYDKTEKLEFEERTDENYSKFKFLEKANSPVRKIMSEKSCLKSSIFTREIVGYILARLAFSKLTKKETDDAQEVIKSLNESNEFNNDDVSKSLDNLFENKQAKEMLENALEKAEQACKSLDETLNSEQQEQMFNACTVSGEASKLSLDYLSQVEDRLKSVSMSTGSLKEKIKKLLDRSNSYFAGRQIPVYEDIFNSDNIAGLDDFVSLHPALRKLMVEDVLIKDTKYIGKVDVYMDVSGSMSDSCGIKDDFGKHISKEDFAKSFVFKLKELDVLNNLFPFDTSVRKCKTDPISIAMLNSTGGTSIDKAVESIEKNGVNAIVITDAEDRCHLYSEKAFFIGVNGAKFNHFTEQVLKEYVSKEQMIIFDGKTIQKVDKTGRPIK